MNVEELFVATDRTVGVKQRQSHLKSDQPTTRAFRADHANNSTSGEEGEASSTSSPSIHILLVFSYSALCLAIVSSRAARKGLSSFFSRTTKKRPPSAFILPLFFSPSFSSLSSEAGPPQKRT
jgi:hypothetical protein